MSLAEQAKHPDAPDVSNFLAPSAASTEADPQYVARAESLRDRAWTEADGFSWNGKLLHPYSLGRHTLVSSLHRADAPSDDLVDLAGIFERIDQYREAAKAASQDPLTDADWEIAKFTDITAYLPMAIKILWFCSHEPKDWRHLRVSSIGAWLEIIDEWAEANVQANQQTFAVTLAYRLRTDYLRMLTIAPPTSASGRDSGNAHGP